MTKYNKDDAMHIAFPLKNREEHYEWWYFDAALDNGDHVVIMYLINDLRLKNRQPSVRTNIYEKNGNEIWEIKKIDEQDVSVSYDRCDVKMGEDFCIDNGDHYEIYTIINGYGAHLKYYPINPPWTRPPKIPPMGWTVAIPYGTVDGVLIKEGKEFPVKGTGYHDHNWGTKSMDKLFRHWYWGKVHTGDVSIDYSVLILKSTGRPLTAVLITDKSGVLVEPKMMTTLFHVKTKLNNIQLEPDLELEFANQLIIKVKKKNIEMQLTIDLDRIIMKRAATFIPSHTGIRYIGSDTTILKRDGVEKTYKTHSLHEVVYLIKK